MGKSSPTTPTSRTGVKKLAAYEKYVAAPPSTSVACPVGVSIVSMPMEPTTSRGMAVHELRDPLYVLYYIQQQSVCGTDSILKSAVAARPVDSDPSPGIARAEKGG